MNASVLTHDNASAIAHRLEPFLQAGALSELALHTVDTLGRHAGEGRPDVLLACALAVQAPTRGHVCVQLDQTDVRRWVAEDTDPELIQAMVFPAHSSEWRDAVAESPLVRPDGPFVLDGHRLYTARYYRYETSLADTLRERLVAERSPEHEALLAAGLAALFSSSSDDEPDWQQVAAAVAAMRSLTVISGGPGTGKTHTVSRVLTLLWAQWAASGGKDVGPRVALAAPTGKAAARMSEAIGNSRPGLMEQAANALPQGATVEQLGTFLDGLQPTTLHRLLGFQPFSPTRFRHNADHPLPHDIVLVDEASMVDVALMAKLVAAVRPDARLVLLGDKNQLASVEAGTVLADIVGTGATKGLSDPARRALERVGLTVPPAQASQPGPQDGIVQLTHSRRFTATSGIGHLAKACLEQATAAHAITLMVQHNDLAFLPHADGGQLPAPALASILEALAPALTKLLQGPADGVSLQQHHREALDALQAFRVLAAHRRGRLGVEGLNRTIAQALAHAVPSFEPGRRHYVGQPILVRRNDPVVGRYNGDVGLIVTDAEGRLTTAFPVEDHIEYLAPARLPEHQTVFAMTIHKSQGSEFEHAMVVLPNADSPLLSQELLYTGVTRAKKRLTLVANEAVLTATLRRRVDRASGLATRLWGAP